MISFLDSLHDVFGSKIFSILGKLENVLSLIIYQTEQEFAKLIRQLRDLLIIYSILLLGAILFLFGFSTFLASKFHVRRESAQMLVGLGLILFSVLYYSIVKRFKIIKK